jgi:hyperosmotically inducible protein
MNTMLNKLALGLVAASGLAFGANTAPPADTSQIEQKVIHEIRMYPKYSIFDNIKIRVDNGNVELLGQVSEPYKKSDLQRLAAHVTGVSSVTNDIEVLPLSPFDNRLRMQVARAIYRDPVLSRYAIEAVPPIHIIVDNGHVTLEGVVSTEMEKDVAGIRANGAGLSFGQVVNNLQVENPPLRKT